MSSIDENQGIAPNDWSGAADAARNAKDRRVTVMIAEVLSPSDTQEEIVERVEEYLACGVPLVWIFNPYFKTVTVHRPGVARRNEVNSRNAGPPRW